MSFSTFSLHPMVQSGVIKAGYDTPTPIQAQAIPAVLAGSDVMGLAQTGTGKTAAFVLPILHKLMVGPRGFPRALILAPTRELAEQTNTAIKTLGKQTGIRSLTIYGGVSSHNQIRGLRAGTEIIVACPGRLLDLRSQGVLDLQKIEILVLDEADHMFDMGFLPSIQKILSALPSNRQNLLFSATMSDEIRILASKTLVKPVTIEIGLAKPIDTITHGLYPVDTTRKHELLLHLLYEKGDGQVLIFTRTKHRAKKLAIQLVKDGFAATSLQGNLSQNQREASMNAFRNGTARVMVATDIAARGIDVSQVSHVINFDLPDTVDAYTHRTGRTGRMERLGTALSLVTTEELAKLRPIQQLLGSSLEIRQVIGFEVNLVEFEKPSHLNFKNTKPAQRRPDHRPSRPFNKSHNNSPKTPSKR
jgi:ATP-dependent RNA helicase RhlE